jgi:hypothetical protein
MIGGSKLSSFKIGEPKLQIVENIGAKTAIKPSKNNIKWCSRKKLNFFLKKKIVKVTNQM